MGRIDRQLTDKPRMDGLLRRIDYIRQTANVPRTGLNAPPGENPYDSEFGVLPYAEIIRLLDKHIPVRAAERIPNAIRDTIITRNDLFRYMGRINEQHWAAFRKGDDSALGRIRLRKLSRIVKQLEAGRLVFRGRKLVLLDEPQTDETPRKPDMRFTLTLETGPRGVLRPTIAPGAPLEAPKTMPKLFKSFKLPGA